MTTLKEELADVVSRITVLEEERAAKIRQAALGGLSSISGVSQKQWDFLTDEQLAGSRARSLAQLIRDLRYVTPVIQKIGYEGYVLWTAVVCAFAIGVPVGAAIMYLWG